MTSRSIVVMCVDDNRLMAEAMQRRIALEARMSWGGWADAPEQAETMILDARPDVVLVDVDLPGHDPFAMVRRLATAAPEVRALMFSGHFRPEFVDRAIDAGAWGYVSKNEATDDVLGAIRRIAAGEFVILPELEVDRRA